VLAVAGLLVKAFQMLPRLNRQRVPHRHYETNGDESTWLKKSNGGILTLRKI
jgi:hypothetical protein